MIPKDLSFYILVYAFLERIFILSVCKTHSNVSSSLEYFMLKASEIHQPILIQTPIIIKWEVKNSSWLMTAKMSSCLKLLNAGFEKVLFNERQCVRDAFNKRTSAWRLELRFWHILCSVIKSGWRQLLKGFLLGTGTCKC